jgi:hypothetical protein
MEMLTIQGLPFGVTHLIFHANRNLIWLLLEITLFLHLKVYFGQKDRYWTAEKD